MYAFTLAAYIQMHFTLEFRIWTKENLSCPKDQLLHKEQYIYLLENSMKPYLYSTKTMRIQISLLLNNEWACSFKRQNMFKLIIRKNTNFRLKCLLIWPVHMSTTDYVYIIRSPVESVIKFFFLISQPKHMLWVLRRTFSISTQNIC